MVVGPVEKVLFQVKIYKLKSQAEFSFAFKLYKFTKPQLFSAAFPTLSYFCTQFYYHILFLIDCVGILKTKQRNLVAVNALDSAGIRHKYQIKSVTDFFRNTNIKNLVH